MIVSLLLALGELTRTTPEPGGPTNVSTPPSRTIVIPGPDGRRVGVGQ